VAQPKSVAPPKSAPAPDRSKTDAPDASAAARKQRDLKGQQQELKGELERLRRQLSASEANQAEAADALATSERAISTTNRRLRELAINRARLEAQISALQARSRVAAARQDDQVARLSALLREQYQLSLRDPVHLLIEGGDPGQLGRDAEYLRYVGRSSEQTIEQLRLRRAELAELEIETRQRRDELAAIEADEARNRTALQDEQARRKKTASAISKQVAAQRNSIAKLESDEKRLGSLVDQLARVLAEQARRDAERARQAAKKRPPEAARATPTPTTPPESPSMTGNFGQLKGKMTLPVSGTIAARFGAPRRADGGASGPTWKGVFIRAPAGTEVHAVGAGRVVFADWLRGFGNLLVIDHGDGFLSVYGNNESLLRNAGDEVAVREPVASVGNTGGNEHPGLYFELRFQGRPFDPLSWVAAR